MRGKQKERIQRVTHQRLYEMLDQAKKFKIEEDISIFSELLNMRELCSCASKIFDVDTAEAAKILKQLEYAGMDL